MNAILIHSVYLSHKNGLNTVLGLLLSNKSLFAENGVLLSSITPDNNGQRYFLNTKKTYKQKIKDLITGTLSKCAQRYGWAVRMIMYIREERFAKMMVQKYLATNPSKDDVVFIHSFFVCYYYLKLRTVPQKTVLVLHNNGDTFKMYRTYYKALENTKYYKKLLDYECFVLKCVDKINFVSKSSRINFLALHPNIRKEKVFYIYNGVDEHPYTPHYLQHTPIEICCVASITERKGQRFILNALSKLNDDNPPNVHFTFLGDGDIKSELEKYASDNRLDKYVTFVGMSNNVVNYLKNSDIFILPSEDEGLPMSILEAMREGLPIVSTPVGGIPEMVDDGVNGILINPSTVGVYEFLRHINEYDWKTMGLNARQTFEKKFSSRAMVLNYIHLLKD